MHDVRIGLPLMIDFDLIVIKNISQSEIDEFTLTASEKEARSKNQTHTFGYYIMPQYEASIEMLYE